MMVNVVITEYWANATYGCLSLEAPMEFHDASQSCQYVPTVSVLTRQANHPSFTKDNSGWPFDRPSERVAPAC